jgi:7-carboxy-7-deazaguanine synthase (Cx14CxxC type)
MYAVKEIFKTLQGEGAQAGRVAVFCRFSGCNLWSGREVDREAATCRFCDTDFIGTNGPGGGVFSTALDLATAIEAAWGAEQRRRFVVFTGGEPLLQLDAELLKAVRERGFESAVETNGTKDIPPGLDWVCVSPKAGALLRLGGGDEVKVVFPQDGIDPATMAELDFRHFWIQPMDGATREANTAAAVRYCLEHPRWRLSLQTHKFIGIP